MTSNNGTEHPVSISWFVHLDRRSTVNRIGVRHHSGRVTEPIAYHRQRWQTRAELRCEERAMHLRAQCLRSGGSSAIGQYPLSLALLSSCGLGPWVHSCFAQRRCHCKPPLASRVHSALASDWMLWQLDNFKNEKKLKRLKNKTK